MDFSEESKSLGPHALFYDMPQKPLLTLGMDPPESWLVESVKTQYDLDNIFLEEVCPTFHNILHDFCLCTAYCALCVCVIL